jgi:hypothetical protein
MASRVHALFCIFLFLLLFILFLTGCGGGSSPQAPQAAQTTAQPAAQAMTVVLQSPGVGTLSTPLPVHATATSPNGVSGWVVYVDDAAAVTVNNSSETMTTSVPLSGGNHIMYVRAWDQGAANFATSPTLQVAVQGTQATVSNASAATSVSTPSAAAAPAPPSALPSIPGNATTWTSIQNMDGWQSCSDCAGGKATTSNFWTAAHQGSPSQSGSSREFFIGGHAWSNALWYKKVAPDQTGAAHFLWDFWVRFDGSIGHAHSAEYDMWQALNGQEFMMGSQCNFASGVWDVWDSKNFAWKPTSATCKRFSPDSWHHIQWYVERWGSHQYHYGVLVVDGKVYTLDRTFETNSASWANSVGVQFQLDQDGSGAPLHEWVDEVKLSVW